MTEVIALLAPVVDRGTSAEVLWGINESWTMVFGIVVTLLFAVALMPVLRRWLIDNPNHRSSHSTPVPRGGGIAVILGMACMSSLAVDLWHPVLTMPTVAILGMSLIGLADDLHSLSIRLRLTGQVLLAAIGVSGLERAFSLEYAVLATILVVGYCNAFNFMDGINGISAVSALVAGFWFAYLAVEYDVGGLVLVGLLLAAPAAGFMPLNFIGRVFLGDVGSYLWGATIAFGSLVAISAGVDAWAALAPMSLAVADTTTTLLGRAVRGHRLGGAHREHAYQRMADRWHSHVKVATYFGALSAAVCVLSLGGPIWALLSFSVVLAYLLTPRLPRVEA